MSTLLEVSKLGKARVIDISAISRNDCLSLLEQTYNDLRLSHRTFTTAHTPFCTYCLENGEDQHTPWCAVNNLKLLIERLKALLGCVTVS